MEQEVLDEVWETVSFSLAIVSLVTLLLAPLYFARLAFKYVRAVKEN